MVGTLAAASLLAAAWGVPPAAATGTKAVGSVAAKAQATPAPAPSFAPAASGTIATILGQDLEVQGTSGQTTVELTAKTTITATVAVSLKDITAGACISATGTKGKDGTVDATLISVSQPVKGSCLDAAALAAAVVASPSGAALAAPLPPARPGPSRPVSRRRRTWPGPSGR